MDEEAEELALLKLPSLARRVDEVAGRMEATRSILRQQTLLLYGLVAAQAALFYLLLFSSR